MKAVSIIVAAGVLLSGALGAGAALDEGPKLANGIKAVVHDAVITYQEVEALDEQTVDVLIRQYRSEPTVLDQKLNEMRKENLKKLLDRQLILREFKTAGYSLPESVLDDLVQERIRSRFGDRMTLTKTLQARGMTYEQFRQQVRDQFIVEQLRIKNISSEIIISPHKIESYYQAHHDDFKVEQEVKLRVIVLKATDDTNAPAPARLAEEILAKVKEGRSFAEMASMYLARLAAQPGGRLGLVGTQPVDQGPGRHRLRAKTNQCSGVFSRNLGDDYWLCQYDQGQPVLGRHYGLDAGSNKQKLLEERKLDNPSALTNLPPAQEYYLLQVEDAHPEHVKPLSEVRDQIEKNLLLEEKTRLETQWLDRLKKKTFVVYF